MAMTLKASPNRSPPRLRRRNVGRAQRNTALRMSATIGSAGHKCGASSKQSDQSISNSALSRSSDGIGSGDQIGRYRWGLKEQMLTRSFCSNSMSRSAMQFHIRSSLGFLAMRGSAQFFNAHYSMNLA